MESGIFEKLTVLGEGAKYDVSCSSSGHARLNVGRIGSAACAGICHSWTADGRCISLLKVLLSNDCVYDCKYCVNRRTADGVRRTFEPRELAELTIEFYRRNYIEGLFLSSAVFVSPDHTAERMYECLWLLREVYGFAGYVHAKIVPGVSAELLTQIGLVADRLSVNIELPSSESLSLLAPQKKPDKIFAPMTQITRTQIEQKTLKSAGNMRRLKPAGYGGDDEWRDGLTGNAGGGAAAYGAAGSAPAGGTPAYGAAGSAPAGGTPWAASPTGGAGGEAAAHGAAAHGMAGSAPAGGTPWAASPTGGADGEAAAHGAAAYGAAGCASAGGTPWAASPTGGAGRGDDEWRDGLMGNAGGGAAAYGAAGMAGTAVFDEAALEAEIADAADVPAFKAGARKTGGHIVSESRRKAYKEKFAPAGQTTQMIIGASPESDRQIIKMSEALYRRFTMKRVYFAAYVPVADSPALPPLLTPPPLKREHRLYQADWLLRFYGFSADEILTEDAPDLDYDLDPKVVWALRHIEVFPFEVNTATEAELLRIPGVGNISAQRIMRQRRVQKVRYEDLKKMGVVLKRARFFLTCDGRYYGGREQGPEKLRALFALEEQPALDAAFPGVPVLSSPALGAKRDAGLQAGGFPPASGLDATAIRGALGGGEKAQLSLFETSLGGMPWAASPTGGTAEGAETSACELSIG